MRRRALLALRFGVTIAAVVWLFRLVDLQQLADALRRTHPWGIGLACLVYLAIFTACGLRWYLLLRPVRRIPFRLVLQWFLIGAFFNTVLPTTVGGDVIRIHETGRAVGDWPKATATVLLDRLTGFTAMVAIGLAAALIALPSLSHPAIRRGVFGLAAVFAVTMGCLANRRVLAWLTAPLAWLRLSQVRRLLQDCQAALHAYGRHRGAVGAALALSFLVQGGSMLLYWMVGMAMGIPIPLWAVFVFVPILMVIAQLPISLNGLGVREGAAVILLGTVGIPEAEALGLSLVCAAIPALSGLWGAWVFVTYRRGLLADAKL